jgi:O-antigen ligase
MTLTPPTWASRANATLAYLALVLVFGGASAAAYGPNLLLQLLGALLAGWTLWSMREPLFHTGLGRFFIALAVLAAVQFVPLPPGLWQHLPGRESVFQGFLTLGVDPPWLTLSLSPWHSLASFAWWIPALSLFLAMRAPGAPPTRHVIWTIAAVAGVSIVFGGLQAGAGSFYFYAITNFGEGPGFFANSNHQGSFLLAALSLWGCWAIGEHRAQAPGGVKSRADLPVVNSALALLLLAGVLVSGSLACLLLLAPVLAALALVYRPDFRLPLVLVLLAGIAVIAGVAGFLLFGPAENDLLTKGAVKGISRQDFLITGAQILKDFAPTGSGAGTFLELYRWYENPAEVSTTFVNHAHDDLLELLIETGVFGLACVVLFLGWFVPRAWKLWAGARRQSIQLAASMVIGVELLHSLVDYPLRTAAMSSVMAIACVLLVRPADAPVSRRGSRSRSRRSDGTREMMKI